MSHCSLSFAHPPALSLAHAACQVVLLGRLVRGCGCPGAEDVEVLTVDRCQGRDKDVLLMSFVRSNPAGNLGHLLADWQRLNVAFTRAKVRLLMVGSAATLRAGRVPLLQQLLDWCGRQRGALVDAPPDALAA